MKDRLIELLRDPTYIKEGDVIVGEKRLSWKDAESLADFLLENGVIVPPCKVGDVVYVIFDMFKKKIETCRVDEFLIGENGMFAVLDVHYPNYHARRRATIPVSWFGRFAFTEKNVASQVIKELKI